MSPLLYNQLLSFILLFLASSASTLHFQRNHSIHHCTIMMASHQQWGTLGYFVGGGDDEGGGGWRRPGGGS
ncbi:hypothetical protein RchiOBHm_Chr4g0434141 [Rosa chinensis]|uniref:Secreted protein n=1 Tax=Rosa chinensis TaxID=74649 RepID=A0A2P6R1E4_ROSCH|nr:hypothetical protein RchiOBHm_Chr4g0434141 [Rosa chinensis]